MENKVELKFENNNSATVVTDEVKVTTTDNATKKITVQEFVDTYKKTPERQRESYLKSLVITDYVPFEMKVALMLDLVQKTHMDNGNVSVKSPLCYALFMNLIVGEYLAVEIDKNNQMRDFNIMNKESIFNDLIYGKYQDIAVSTKEFAEFQTVLEMVKDDFSLKHLSMGLQVNNFIQKLTFLIDLFGENIDDILNNIDKNNVVKNIWLKK